MDNYSEKDVRFQVEKTQNVFRPFENNHLTYKQPYLLQLQNPFGGQSVGQSSSYFQQKHVSQQQESQLSPPVTSGVYENYDSREEEGGDEDSEESDNNQSSFDGDAEDTFVETGRKLLQNLRDTVVAPCDSESEIVEKMTDNKENIDRELLIECVRQYPVLWNLKHPNHKDNTKKKIIWQMIQKASFQERDGKFLNSILNLKTHNRIIQCRPNCFELFLSFQNRIIKLWTLRLHKDYA